MFVVPGERTPAGLPVTRTGIVTGWKSFKVKLTVKSLKETGTLTAHGVVQLCPIEVRASAPEGVDSNSTCKLGGLGVNNPQPARLSPAIASMRMACRNFLIEAL
jgi:hypothetical protein